MMRSLKTLLALFLLTSISTTADDDIADVEAAIKAQIIKDTSVEAKPIKDRAVATCFGDTFYRVTVSRKSGRGTSSQENIYAKSADGWLEVTEPGTGAEMPGLLKLVKPGFTLKREADGKAMMAALKALFLECGPFDDDVDPRVVQKGTTWKFITGEFFKDDSGFVMETDAAGAVTSIKRQLRIPAD